MRWPWRGPEVRSANYTEQIVSRLVAAASGAAGDGGTLGVVEVAVAGGQQAWQVLPFNPTTLRSGLSLRQSWTALAVRFAAVGESLHVIDVRGDRVTLTPCAVVCVGRRRPRQLAVSLHLERADINADVNAARR